MHRKESNARKRDVSSVVDAVASYVGNNPTGILTGSGNQIDDAGKGDSSKPLGKYIDTLSTSTDEVDLVAKAGASAYMNGEGIINGDKLKGSTGSDRTTRIVVIQGYTCDGTTKIKTGATRSYAVVGGVETSGSTPEPYCQSAN